MNASNVHDLDARRAAADAAADADGTEFEPLGADDLLEPGDLPVSVVDDETPAEGADDHVLTADALEALADAADAEAASDVPASTEQVQCTHCFGATGWQTDDEWETCAPCGGTGIEGAQGTLVDPDTLEGAGESLEGAGDEHAETGQVRAFDASQFEVKASRLGGRRATTGKVAISGGSIDALKLDERNRIPKGATIRLEVVGDVLFVGERDKLKDGYHAGTVREHAVKANHVQVVSWLHDEDGLRWDEAHGLRVKRGSQWVGADETTLTDDDEAALEPVLDGDEPTAPEGDEPPNHGDADGSPEGVPDAPAEDGGGEGGEVPTELPASSGQEGAGDDETGADGGTPPLDGSEPQKATTTVKAAQVILGRPETYTTDALGTLGKADLREVLTDLGVSDLPARIDKSTLFAMANTAAGNA